MKNKHQCTCFRRIMSFVVAYLMIFCALPQNTSTVLADDVASYADNKLSISAQFQDARESSFTPGADSLELYQKSTLSRANCYLTFKNEYKYAITVRFTLSYNKTPHSSPGTGEMTISLASGKSKTLSSITSNALGGTLTTTVKDISVTVDAINITASTSDSNRGTVSVSNSNPLPESVLTFVATPKTYDGVAQRVELWRVIKGNVSINGTEYKVGSEIVASGSNLANVMVTEDTEIQAIFGDVPQNIDLTLNFFPSANGSVSVGTIQTVTSSTTVAVQAESGELTLAAIPDEGYAFAGWIPGTVSELGIALTDENLITEHNMTIMVGKDNQTWTAIFLKAYSYVAIVRENDPGVAFVNGTSQIESYLGQVVVYQAIPNEGYVFDGWYNNAGQCISTSSEYEYLISEETNLTLEARFRNPRVYVSLGTGVTGISAVDAEGKVYSYSNLAFDVTVGTTLTMTVTYDDSSKETDGNPKYTGIYGWYNNATTAIVPGTADELTYTVTISTAKDHNYTVFAKDASDEMVGVCKNLSTGIIYGSVHDGLKAASSGQTVMLIQPISVDADLEIPFGVTFLVPYSSTDTGAREFGESGIGKPFVFGTKDAATMIISEGISVDVYGTLLINAKQGYSSTAYQGCISGAYGLILLEADSTIIVRDGGALNSRGMIQGTGKVETKYGGTVSQFIEILDWRGGSLTKDIVLAGSNIFDMHKLFPVNQFALQNIQVDLVINYGSSLNAEYYVYAGTGKDGSVSFVGRTSSNLFKMESGAKIVLRYEYERDGEVVSKTIVDIYGAVSINSFSLTISFSGLSLTMSTEVAPCPLSAIFDVNVMPEATFTISEEFRVMPGVTITIHEGGTVNIPSSGKLYLYDVEDFDMSYTTSGSSRVSTGFCYVSYRRLPQTCKATSKYLTVADDAVLIVNGTLIVNGGLYSSAGAGNQSSSIRTTARTGIVLMNAVGASSLEEYDYNTGADNSGSAGFVTVDFCTARAHLVTCDCSDGTCEWTELSATVYFSNGSAWYTHKTEFEQNGEVLEDLTVYGVGAYGNVDAIVNRDTSSSCEFGNGYTCTHWAKESETAGTKTAPYKPYVIVYARDVSLNSTGFTLDYRLNDYIWMNAVVTIPASGTVELVDNYGGTIQLVPGANGTYYIVRKVLSTDLTTDFVVQFKIGDVTTQTYAVGFPAFAALDNGAHEELVDAMLTYGKAADSYFQNVPWQGSNLTPPIDENGNILWDAYTKGAATHGASAGLDGISVRTSGVSAYFDNRIGFTVWFALKNGNGDRSSTLLDTLNNMYGANSIVQIGVLVGDENYSGELTTEEGKYTNAYLLYNSSTVSGADQNFPVNPEDDKTGLLGGTTHSTLTYDQIKEAMANTYNDTTKKESGCGLSFDIPTSDYMSVYKLRLFVVLDKTPTDSTDAEYEVLYGSQNNYGLPTYLKATYQNGTDEYKNFVCAAWDYITKAEAAFPETKQ